VEVIAAYPITPQSQLSEILSQYVESGELKAEYVRVEGEHSALTVCISASTVGARVFTATSANGLLYMHEQLHWAAGSRLPIVMCCVNRGVGAPWTIFNDQQDSLAQRDTGWMQIYCRNNQEILDTVIQAYRIAEAVYCPVMVCYDGFVLSHTMMPVDIPTPPTSRPSCLHTSLTRFCRPMIRGISTPFFSPGRGGTAKASSGTAIWKCVINCRRRWIKPPKTSGLQYGLCQSLRQKPRWNALGIPYERCRFDHRRDGVPGQRSHGRSGYPPGGRHKGGVVGIRVYRPFPKEDVRDVFRNAKAVVIFEKSISYGYEGGLCSDLKAAFYGTNIKAPIHNYIAGLGGRDVKARELVAAAKDSLAGFDRGVVEPKTTWLSTFTG